VGETEQTRVQGLTGKRDDPGPNRATARDVASGARAIDRIADQRVSAMGEMYPDLMRSAGRKTAFNEGRLRAERAFDTIMRDRRLSPAIPDNGHLLAIRDTATDVARDLSGERDWYTPNNCGIATVHSAQHKVARKCVMRQLGFGDDHQPARALVEAMNDTRPANPADPGEARTAMADQGVDERPLRVSRRGVDNQPCRFVDDDQMPILELNIQRNRLRNRGRVCIIGKKYDEILAAADPQRGVAQRCPFASDMAGMDQPFEPGARESRKMECKRTIEALPRLAGAGKDDSPRGAGGHVGFSCHDRAFLSNMAKGVSPD